MDNPYRVKTVVAAGGERLPMPSRRVTAIAFHLAAAQT